MKFYTKIPLYFGLFVLVGSVLTSAIAVSERKTLTYLRTKAAANEAQLALNFSPPNLVSVYLTGIAQISGIDVTIKFDKTKIVILPSSLTAGTNFITSGGIVDEEGSIFSFSALPNKSVNNGVVASFTLQPVGGKNRETSLQFVPESAKTAVFEKTTGNNILTKATGVKFTP